MERPTEEVLADKTSKESKKNSFFCFGKKSGAKLSRAGVDSRSQKRQTSREKTEEQGAEKRKQQRRSSKMREAAKLSVEIGKKGLNFDSKNKRDRS